MRRVSIQIEHREVSISLTIHESGIDASQRALPVAVPSPASCSVCGAQWVPVVPNSTYSNAPEVLAAFLQCGLHPPLYSGGTLWICGQSLQQGEQ